MFSLVQSTKETSEGKSHESGKNCGQAFHESDYGGSYLETAPLFFLPDFVRDFFSAVI